MLRLIKFLGNILKSLILINKNCEAQLLENRRNWLFDISKISTCAFPLFPHALAEYFQHFLKRYAVLVNPPWSTILLCCWFIFGLVLIILGNCVFVVLYWVVISWFQGYQLGYQTVSTSSTQNNDMADTTKIPGPPISLLYFLLYYRLWHHARTDYAHAAKRK